MENIRQRALDHKWIVWYRIHGVWTIVGCFFFQDEALACAKKY